MQDSFILLDGNNNYDLPQSNSKPETSASTLKRITVRQIDHGAEIKASDKALSFDIPHNSPDNNPNVDARVEIGYLKANTVWAS